MPEALTGNLRMDAARKHVGSVPKIVEPQPGQGGARNLAIPIMCEGVGLERVAVLSSAYEGGIRYPRAESQKLLGLPNAVRPQNSSTTVADSATVRARPDFG
jgi:hypothetical protein